MSRNGGELGATQTTLQWVEWEHANNANKQPRDRDEIDGTGGEEMSDEAVTTCEVCYCQVVAIYSRMHDDWHSDMERQLRGWS
jgi:hypothetical protein